MTSSSDGLIALCAKRINELHAAFAKLSKMPGPQGPAGKDGESIVGPRGETGERGIAGPRGEPGLRGEIGESGPRGEPGLRGERGEPGPAGKDGERGPMPDHEWSGTKVRFQKPDGEWGKFVQLRGPKGEKGAAGASGGGGFSIGGSSFDPSTLPTAADSPVPDEVLVQQDGQWVRASWAQFSGWLGTVPEPTANRVLTEDGNVLVTEDGNYIVQE